MDTFVQSIEWLNYSFDTYKLKCKTALLTWQQYKQPDGQLIKQIRLDLIQSVKT